MADTGQVRRPRYTQVVVNIETKALNDLIENFQNADDPDNADYEMTLDVIDVPVVVHSSSAPPFTIIVNHPGGSRNFLVTKRHTIRDLARAIEETLGIKSERQMIGHEYCDLHVFSPQRGWESRLRRRKYFPQYAEDAIMDMSQAHIEEMNVLHVQEIPSAEGGSKAC